MSRVDQSTGNMHDRSLDTIFDSMDDIRDPSTYTLNHFTHPIRRPPRPGPIKHIPRKRTTVRLNASISSLGLVRIATLNSILYREIYVRQYSLGSFLQSLARKCSVAKIKLRQ
jgi:hypothetical protein